MMKKLIIVIVCISILLLILSLILLVTRKKNNDVIYKKYKIDNYSFEVLDDYKYKYDKDKKVGYLSNKTFDKSYIYLSSKKYKDLISLSAYYEDMGGKEVDSEIDEIKIGKYDAFLNIKEVEYKDVEEHNYLVMIFIKVSEENTFVFQYETKALTEEKRTEILNNIKEGLNNIEEIK